MQSQNTVPQQSTVVLFPVFSQIHAVPEPISQVELGLLLSLRDRLTKIQRDVDAAETRIRERLEAGATIQPGELSASLRRSKRRSVPWKAVASRLAKSLGYDPATYCAKVLNSTKPSVGVHLEITRAQHGGLLSV